MMLRCKDVAELVGTDAIEGASLATRLHLRLHLAMCRHCRAYVRSIRQLAQNARRLVRDVPLSEARESALLQAVRRAIADAAETPPAPSS